VKRRPANHYRVQQLRAKVRVCGVCVRMSACMLLFALTVE